VRKKMLNRLMAAACRGVKVEGVLALHHLSTWSGKSLGSATTSTSMTTEAMEKYKTIMALITAPKMIRTQMVPSNLARVTSAPL